MDRALSPSASEWLRPESTPSTNSLLTAHPDRARLPHGTVCATRCQSAGRGQRGNKWEAAPGLNITLSVLLRPEGVHVRDQFAISEAVALGVTDMLGRYIDPALVRIKWPNDIYVGDSKICGILIEQAVCADGMIDNSVAGVGVNVNQTVWLSDAPNPVSMAQTTGREYSLDLLEPELVEAILARFGRMADSGRHDEYMSRLWRADGAYSYIDAATGERFEATIEGVEPSGALVLGTADGGVRRYMFKEVAFVL